MQFNYGIKTGFNDAFIINNQTKEALVAEDPKSAEVIKPVLRGKDIQRYQAQWKGHVAYSYVTCSPISTSMTIRL